MSITGAQMKKALSAVPGAATGQVCGWDQLASGASEAMRVVGCKTTTECALFLATMAMESGYFRTTTEYGSGQSYAPYVGRTFEQLTWASNYSDFGKWCKARGYVTDPAIFVKNPARLSDLRWAWLGGTYFWSVKRSWGSYSSVIDVARKTGSILAVSRAVNIGNPNSGSTPYGMAARTTMFNAFKALGSSIIPGAASSAPTAPTTQVQQKTPAGAIPGTAAMVLATANALWNQYKGRLYAYAWPGWRELPYGITSGYWCAAFVSLCFKKSTGFDWKNYVGKSGPAYCPALVTGMSKSSMWHEVKYRDAKGGDVVFFFRGSLAYHVGLVESGPTSAGHDMRTIEGNTSTPGMTTSMSAGGTLAKKVRDDRYFSMRIFRPTYWAPAPTTTPASTSVKEAVDKVDVVPVDETDAPKPSVIADISAPGDVDSNPLDVLNMSEPFLASIEESSTRWCRVSAGLQGHTIVENLPVVADSSKVSVDATRSVRRQASLTIQPDPLDETHAGLRTLLATPGLEIRVEVGFSWGTYHEAVPVFDGVMVSSKWDWESGRIALEAQDRMAYVAWKGFDTACMANAACTYVDAIRGLIGEADRRAKVVDLTGNAETMPSVIWGLDGGSSRIDAVMELAMAIGAEVFKSPAPDVYLIRPIAVPGQVPKWTTEQGRSLVSLSEITDDTKLRNHIEAKSTRSDGPTLQAGWKITDPDSPFHEDKIGDRKGDWSTALLSEREQLEEAARSIVYRLIGARMNIEFTRLVNPLMEAGDTNRVVTAPAQWDVVVDAFEVPLGVQATTGATARTMEIEGVS